MIMSKEKTLDELFWENMINQQEFVLAAIFNPSPPPNPKEVDDGEDRDD